MDHLVHMLVTVMIPSYVIQHVCQELGFKGLNLASKHCKEILAQTPEINAKFIHNLGNDQFNVQSVTDSTCTYLVNLSTQSCGCPDWPRVQLCKHLTAVTHFFGRDEQIVLDVVPKTVQPIQEGLVGACSDASAVSILENVIAISRAFLNDGALLSPEMV